MLVTLLSGYAEVESDSNDDEVERRLIPNEADFLLSYSTVPGYASFRHTTTGSCYISELTELLDQHSHE